MKRNKFFIIKFSLTALCLTTAANVACAQEVEARRQPSLEDARAVLVRLAELSRKQELRTEAAQNLLTGEMLKTKANSFGKLTEAPDKILLTEKNRAVGRFQMSGAHERAVDVYFYLEYDKSWKIYASRATALAGIFEQSYSFMKNRTDLSETEKLDFANLKLTLAPDRDLRVWFSENRQKLDELRALLQKTGGKTSTVYVGWDEKQFPEAFRMLRKLNLRTAIVKPNGDVEIVIGGISDNTVGFLYSPSNKPPAISPDSYIWVEKVAEKWFLFRTT
ncbi:MAG TPA: hypothetical protein VF599_13550 [Pyrinomonadaceae bacterium]